MANLPVTVSSAAGSEPSRARNAPWLRGIVPPVITPLSERDTLDVAGFERLLEHILAGGVHGLFLLGTSAEAPHLSIRLRKDLVVRACRQVNGRVPVLVGITDSSIVEALHMAGHAAEAGAKAVVCAPPFYVPPSQEELAGFFQKLAADLPLPLFLYNAPFVTKTSISLETLRLLAQLETIAGIKDSSGDLDYFGTIVELKRERPDWSFFVGPERLLPATLRAGGDGGVNGGANFMPQLFVSLFNAIQAGDTRQTDQLEKTLLALNAIYTVDSTPAAGIKAMKCACSLLGICGDRMAEPFEALSKFDRHAIRAVLESVGLAPKA
jgi:4-hydroxy-tetrahydrodipicolinate synthase